MGGHGSGRRDGKKTTGEMGALDVRRLYRDGLLTPGRVFSCGLTRGGREVASIRISNEADCLTFSHARAGDGGEWRRTEYLVRLDWTVTRFGGRRVWFRCPASGCGRRVAILFGGSTFACRHCHQLAYRCQRETVDDRAARRADTIRKRLGWKPGILNASGLKPKGMRWRTFERLRAKHDGFVAATLLGIARRLRLKTPDL